MRLYNRPVDSVNHIVLWGGESRAIWTPRANWTPSVIFVIKARSPRPLVNARDLMCCVSVFTFGLSFVIYWF